VTLLILFLFSSFHPVMTLEKFHIFIFNVRLPQKSKHVSVQSSCQDHVRRVLVGSAGKEKLCPSRAQETGSGQLRCDESVVSEDRGAVSRELSLTQSSVLVLDSRPLTGYLSMWC